MKLCVIGSGYVGLVAGTCFAESGNDVVCVDSDAAKIELLRKGQLPIYEPGLVELLRRNLRECRLRFTTSLREGLQTASICFVAVGTPANEDGSSDLRHVLDVSVEIGNVLEDFKIIATKSTVPVGTAERIRDKIASCLLRRGVNSRFVVASNPEFLKEGSAVEDFMKPERVILGLMQDGVQPAAELVQVEELFAELYAPFTRTRSRLLVMDSRSAELTKYAANAMLAIRISFMNEMANLCERLGANVDHLRTGLGSDSRIGSAFLFPGMGYGGSCFPKDIRALLSMGQACGYPLTLVQSVHHVNGKQRTVLFEKIDNHYQGMLENRHFALWGLAFKARTDDVRESPAISLVERLLQRGARVTAYDPEASENAKRVLGEKIRFAQHNYDALPGADALIICTEWNEFRRPDLMRVKDLLKAPVIFDGRNLFNPVRMAQLGFHYVSVGRPVPPSSEK